jgi:hypothetical protein
MAARSVDDGLGDWRIAAAARLAKDLPGAFPGGPSHRAGTPVYQTELVQTKTGEYLGFLTPSATAMAFSIALAASRKAKGLFDAVTYDRVLTPHGPAKSISNARTGELFDFFEQCMISATFSFQALEVYANHTIARHARDAMEIKRGKKLVRLTPSELERQLSTEEKLGSVLPKIRNVATPKGKAVWDKFLVLKDTRDATIHLKSQDMRNTKGSGKEHLFFNFLNLEPSSFPKAAKEMVEHFEKGHMPRWLSALNSGDGI